MNKGKVEGRGIPGLKSETGGTQLFGEAARVHRRTQHANAGQVAPDELDRLRFEESHPSDKNKNVARMGHPPFWGQPAAVHLWT